MMLRMVEPHPVGPTIDRNRRPRPTGSVADRRVALVRTAGDGNVHSTHRGDSGVGMERWQGQVVSRVFLASALGELIVEGLGQINLGRRQLRLEMAIVSSTRWASTLPRPSHRKLLMFW